MAETLTDEECKEVFTLFDKDEDGRITTKELGTAMRSLGLNLTKAEVQEMVEEIDARKGGVIDFPLFVELLERKVKTSSESEEALRDAFRVFDKEQKGSISVSELRNIMTKYGEKLTEKQVEETIGDANVDADGQINYAELAKLLMTK